jgi:hypothetical protein
MPDTQLRYTDPVFTKDHVTPPSPPHDDDDQISLKPMFEVLWAYRQTLRNGLLIAAAAVAVLLVAAWFLVPADRFGTLHFRVLFEGADQGRYPNGTPFSSSEVVATPVLDEVYKANDLQRYMDFTSLKKSMFALESNPELELLSYEYQTKLSDPKLTPVDRARIEDEFRKKLESLKSAEFSLNLRRSERMKKLPASLVTKVLDDTLSEWARQAREQKGALKYDIAVFSGNILQRDVVRNEDYIIAVDILRTKVSKILTNIDLISKVPGAALIADVDRQDTPVAGRDPVQSGRSAPVRHRAVHQPDYVREAYARSAAVPHVHPGPAQTDRPLARSIALAHEGDPGTASRLRGAVRGTTGAPGRRRTVRRSAAPLNTPALIPQLRDLSSNWTAVA